MRGLAHHARILNSTKSAAANSRDVKSVTKIGLDNIHRGAIGWAHEV
jgi:hypothetical protein